MNSSTIISIALLVAASLFAQPVDPPAVERWSVYDYGIEVSDSFQDIYATADGGFIMCGYSLNSPNATASLVVVRIDEEYRDIWQRQHRFDRPSSRGFSVIETDDGDFLVGGNSGSNASPEFFATLIDADGNPIWNRQYVRGQSGGRCEAVLELKGGNFILAGAANHYPWSGHAGYVLCIEPDGEIVWEYEYPTTIFKSMRETNGGIVLIGEFHGQNPYSSVIIKINFNGDLLWDEFPDIGAMEDENTYAGSIVSSPEGGFAVAGSCYLNFEDARDPAAYLLKIDGEGQREWVRHYSIDPPERGKAVGLAKMNDGSGYILTGNKDIMVGDQERTTQVMQAIRVTSRGIFRWRSIMPDGEILNLPGFRAGFNNGAVIGADNSMLAVGYSSEDDLMDNNRNNGIAILVKLEPDNLPAPYIIFLPENSLQSVLPGDSIIFSAEPVNFFNDQITYLWVLNEDTLAYDERSDSTIGNFPDFNESEMYGAVFAEGDLAGEKTWHITVDDFFIRECTPDSLHLTARRGSTLSFTLDVACVEPDAPTIEWSTVNRDNDREYLGEADSIDVLFDLAGEWAVEAEAIWGEEREEVRWAVDVRSAVWWWLPHEEAISVNQNERREFSVFPFDPDSDSLSIAWWLDGDSLDCAIEALSLDFPDLGEHLLTTIVHDGIEADTIHWQITVNDGSGATDLPTTPTKLALFPPAPNPFNSTTTIGYSLPAPGAASLTVYDLSGREVARLVDGVKAAGTHEAVWVADGMASGVYLVRLKTPQALKTEKMLLLR